MSWPVALGAWQIHPLAPARRAEHVRKHLLNPREAFWQLSPTLSQSSVRETARRFARGDWTAEREAEALKLHDDHYEPLYRALFLTAAVGQADVLEHTVLANGETALRITDGDTALVVVAQGSTSLLARTAYRCRNPRDAVRKHRHQASLEMDAEGDAP